MLALVLGSGRLAVHVAGALLDEGRAFRVLHLVGTPPDAEAAPTVPRQEFRIENLGRVIADLVRDGVTEVAFAGTIGRPDLDPSKVDPQTMPLIPAMMGALQSGDDAALRAVIGIFEDAGLTVRGADELAPDLLPKAGILTEVSPTDRDRSDVVRAAEIVDALGAVDVGQGAVVSSGLAVAVEALPGTDAMLETIADMRRTRGLPSGGVLWKAPKPGQDVRIDRPTIGPGTVVAAANAGLSGIAVPAGAVLFPDRDEAIAAANASGLFLWVKGED